jgi:hypothetical protein
MFSSRIIAFILLLLVSPASAQVPQTGAGGTAANVPYVGPTDAVAGATHWYGFRAVNAAFAATKGKIVELTDEILSRSCYFDAAANGGFGTTDSSCAQGGGINLLTWANLGTCTGTIASTTLTCTGATATPVANDTISDGGAHIKVAIVIVSCGTFTGGSGTCTIAMQGPGSLPTISSAETITITNELAIDVWPDQVGSVNFSSAGITFFNPVCFGANVPCIGGSTLNLTGTFTSQAQPYSLSTVVQRGTTGSGAAFTDSGGNNGIWYQSAANTISMEINNSPIQASATTTTVHAVQGVANGSSSLINVDGSSTTGSSSSTAITLLEMDTITGGPPTVIAEAGIWNLAFTTPNLTSLCHNQYTFYNAAGQWTGGSC